MKFRSSGVGEKIAETMKGVLGVRIKNAAMAENELNCSPNAQIEFQLKDYLARTATIVQFELIFSKSDSAPSPVLSFDYGNGFSQTRSIKMQQRHDGKYIAFAPFPHLLKSVRLEPFAQPARARVASLVARRASAHDLSYFIMRAGFEVAKGRLRWKAEEGLARLLERLPTVSTDDLENQADIIDFVFDLVTAEPPEGVVSDLAYLDWIARNEDIDETDVAWMRSESQRWPRRPLLSILMPVFDPPIHLLEEAVASLQGQIYENWELCIADDASRNPDVRACISRLATDDPRIRPVFRNRNGHISEATNSAAEVAQGEYLVLMDNDDVLPRHALWTVAHYALANPAAAMLFSDEDKLNLEGIRFWAYSKGAFDRFLMYGHNMFSHLGVYKRDLFEKVGGFRKGYEGSQDYDLTLRCLDEVGEDRIVHIPHVLYHWRQIPGSTSISSDQKNYAYEAAKRAIDDHFVRNRWPLQSVDSVFAGFSAVRALSLPDAATVSIVIPTRDGYEYLSNCIDSIRRFSDPLMDVVIVDNGSVDKKTLDYLAGLSREPHRYRVFRDDGDFNFSRLINAGVAAARGRIVCLLNDDTEFLDTFAFERARALLSIDDVGIVGARLLYPDMTIQHFGVHLGVGELGIAEHAYLGLADTREVNFGKSRLLQQFSAVTAACMFFRKDTFTDVGGFDETFPVAYNDVDFCLRVRQRGLKIVCDPDIRLIHHESKTRGSDASPEKRKRLEADAARILARHGASGLKDPFYSPNFGVEHSTYTLGKVAPVPPWKAPSGSKPAKAGAA